MRELRTLRPKQSFASAMGGTTISHYDTAGGSTWGVTSNFFVEQSFSFGNGVTVRKEKGAGTWQSTNTDTNSSSSYSYNIAGVSYFSKGNGVSVYIDSAGRTQNDDSFTFEHVFEYDKEITVNTVTTVKTTSSFQTTTSYYTILPTGTGYFLGTSSKTINVSSHRSGFSDITKTITTNAFSTTEMSLTADVDMERGTVYIPERDEWAWNITNTQNNLSAPKFISEIASSFSNRITVWPIYGSSQVPYVSVGDGDETKYVNIPSNSTSYIFQMLQPSTSIAATVTSGSYFPRDTRTSALFLSKTTSFSFSNGAASYSALGVVITESNFCSQFSSLKTVRSLYPTNVFGSSFTTLATTDTYLKEMRSLFPAPTFYSSEGNATDNTVYHIDSMETFFVQFRKINYTSPPDTYLVETPPSNNFVSPNDIAKKPYEVKKFGSNLQFSNQTIYYPFMTGILQGILIPFDGISSGISPSPKRGTWKYSWAYNTNGATLCYSNTMDSASTTSSVSSGVFSVSSVDNKSYYSFNNNSGFGGYPDFPEKSVTAFLGKKAVYGVSINTAGVSTTYRSIRTEDTSSVIRGNIRYEQTVPAYLGYTTADPFPNYVTTFSRNNTD